MFIGLDSHESDEAAQVGVGAVAAQAFGRHAPAIAGVVSSIVLALRQARPGQGKTGQQGGAAGGVAGQAGAFVLFGQAGIGGSQASARATSCSVGRGGCSLPQAANMASRPVTSSRFERRAKIAGIKRNTD